jgi:hypothetical protein
LRLLYNILSLQVGWFACILAASYGLHLLGPLVVLGLLVIHLSTSDNRRREVLLLLTAGLLGTILDSILLSTGAIAFPSEWAGGLVPPLWMTALWMNFAATVNVSMRWLNGRYPLAVLLGAISGPMAYYAGAKLGAVSLTASWSLIGIGLEWAVAMPVLLLVNHQLSRPVHGKPALPEAAG